MNPSPTERLRLTPPYALIRRHDAAPGELLTEPADDEQRVVDADARTDHGDDADQERVDGEPEAEQRERAKRQDQPGDGEDARPRRRPRREMAARTR